MKVEEQFQNGFEPLEEAQLVQQFQVEELEKRYEFSWFRDPKVLTPYGTGEYTQ